MSRPAYHAYVTSSGFHWTATFHATANTRAERDRIEREASEWQYKAISVACRADNLQTPTAWGGTWDTAPPPCHVLAWTDRSRVEEAIQGIRGEDYEWVGPLTLEFFRDADALQAVADLNRQGVRATYASGAVPGARAQVIL